jgi:hypothetical protein
MPELANQPEESPGAPRWVKVFGILALLLIVGFAVLHLTGLYPHGHTP